MGIRRNLFIGVQKNCTKNGILFFRQGEVKTKLAIFYYVLCSFNAAECGAEKHGRLSRFYVNAPCDVILIRGVMALVSSLFAGAHVSGRDSKDFQHSDICSLSCGSLLSLLGGCVFIFTPLIFQNMIRFKFP